MPSRRDERFVVNVAALRRSAAGRQEVHLSGPIDDLRVIDTYVPERAEVHFDGVVEAVPGGVMVTGTASAPYAGPCRRCLCEAHGEIHAAVREFVTSVRDPDSEYRIEGDTLDLRPVAHDACILELPLAPLCREGCLGLCPECGADMNAGPHSCPPSGG